MSKNEVIHDESVISKIHLIRGHKVMLDMDLAELYGVLTKNLKKAVRRNLDRFPEDFMFELNMEEMEKMRFHSGTSSFQGGTNFNTMAFTEQGVAMLSSVLNSEQAVFVNIQIMRVFTKVRDLYNAHKEILAKLKELEQQGIKHEEDIERIFEYLRELVSSKTDARPIGFQYNQT